VTTASRSYERIKVARAGTVEVVTLNNPRRRNAIGPRMMTELWWAIDDAKASADVRSIVLTGEGPAFCSGGDFAEIMAGPTGQAEMLPARDFVALLTAIARSDKPIVAKVNGDALGGGLGLAAASTFALASTSATLGTPEIDVGIFPMVIMAVLSRHVPRRRLVEMMLLGQKFAADEAERLGLINRAVAPDRLDAEVTALTDSLAAKSPTAVRAGLRAYAAQDGLELERALPLLQERLVEVLGTDDAREGLTAFLQKRPPVWTGR
jgi:enoyl-CoA hydratase/carnithine racemase